jgi:pyruvate formate lyase activating enzyme
MQAPSPLVAIAGRLGHPEGSVQGVPRFRTPPETLRRARQIAYKNGVRYAYVGNVHDAEADSTYCHSCRSLLIGRDWYEITGWHLESEARCRGCGTVSAGVFEPHPGQWGRRRLPVQLTAFRN